MASLEQKIAAEILRERCRKLLEVDNGERILKEKEAERLFFWILNRLDDVIMESDRSRDVILTIEETTKSNYHCNIVSVVLR